MLFLKVDNSILSSYRSCPFQCYWRYVEHLSLSTKKEPALFFGRVWHKCVSTLWLSGWDYIKALSALDALWIDTEGDNKLRTKERMVTALAEYAANEDYASEFHEWELAADEVFVSVPLGNGVTYCGNLDKVLRRGDEWVVLDHKTSTWNHVCDAQYEMEPQFMGYVWLLHKSYGIPLSKISFCLDMLFMQGKENKFYRRSITYSPEKVGRWFDETFLLTNHLNNSPNPFPFHAPKCSDFGNCQFTYLCNETNEETISILRETMYSTKVWDFNQPPQAGKET